MNARDKLLAEDREWLMQQPQFQRHLFEFQSAAGIYASTREEQHALYMEGKRSLGLEILGWFTAEKAEPYDVIATVLEAGMQISKGATNDHRNTEHE